NPSAVWMTGIERAAQFELPVQTSQLQPEHSGNARHSAIRYCDNQLECAVPLSLPNPRRAEPVTEVRAQAFEAPWIGLVIAGKVCSLSPERPIIRTQIQRVQHVVFQHVHAVRVFRQLGDIVLPEVSVFENCRQPRWPVRDLIDLNWFFNNDAV